jgi:arylsulfatase A-like enzyme
MRHRMQAPTLGIAVGAALGVVVLGAACKSDRAESTSPPAAAQGTPPTSATPPRARSVRTRRHVHRPLLIEAARAELDVGGLFIDFGTPDDQKYTRGAWGTGWGATARGSKGAAVTLARADANNTGLDVHLPRPATALLLRARSPIAGQKVTLYLDGKAIRSADVPPEWTTVTLPLDTEAPAGRHDVRLVYKSKGTPAAEIDWAYFARADAIAPATVPRVMPINIAGAPKRALVAPSARTFVFYLEPPAHASLVFDYASDKATEFVVAATVDGHEPKVLFRAKAGASWQEGDVDLGAFAGKAVRLELTTSGPDGVTGWGEPEILTSERAPPVVRAEAADKPAKNVIFLLIDTARADAFSPFNPKTKVTTPAFDAMASKAVVFGAAYNNENWTKPSVATSLTGTYPVTHDTKTDSAALPADIVLGSEHMKAAGLATGAFVANGYVSEKFGFEQGWDVFRNYIREKRQTEAEHVFRDALGFVKERKPGERFFVYIQTIDPHVPYKPPESFIKAYHPGPYRGPFGPSIDTEEQLKLSKDASKYSAADRAWLAALYHGEISYHDHQMGLFFAEIEKLGLLPDTAVVITNDHGEELGEHGRWGHGHSLYEELIRAPLVVKYDPVFTPGTRVDEVVEHVDLMPTLLDVLGLPPLKEADGVSMLPLLRGEPAMRPAYAVSEFGEGRRAVRVGRWKLQRSTGSLRTLFDVVDDPGETADLYAKNPIALRMCEVHLGETLATPDKSQRLDDAANRRRFSSGKANIDPETRRQLEALGYFGE